MSLRAAPSVCSSAGVAVALALIAFGCGGSQGTPQLIVGGSRAALDMGVLQSINADGSLRFTRRFDGGIRLARGARVISDRDEILVIMNESAGNDQGCIFVLDGWGKTLARYRVSGVTPWHLPSDHPRSPGQPRRQRQAAHPDITDTFVRGGRRFLYVGTQGMYFPSALVVLEADPAAGLRERMVFWNVGTVHKAFVGRSHLVMFGLNNAFRGENGTTRSVLATFALDEVASDIDGAPVVRGVAPRKAPNGKEEPNIFGIYVCLPNDRGRWLEWTDPRISAGHLTATASPGLSYEVNLDTGSLKLSAQEAYREAYRRERRQNTELPDIDSHLRAMEAATIVCRGAP